MILNLPPVRAHIAEYDGGSAEHLALLAKALGHPARIQIIETLLKRQTCIGCDIVEEIGLAASTTSEHLRILKEAGLIGNNVKVDANTIALEVASDPNAAAVMSQLEPGESSMPVQPEITENEAAVQRDSNTLYTENPTKPMENTNKPGLLSWVQANPLPSLAVAGIVSLIAYNLTSKESKSSSKGLSGYRSGKSRKSSKSSKSGRKKKRRIDTVLLR